VELGITKLLGPAKWTYFYLYVIMDIFSRYVVGWMVAHQESAALASGEKTAYFAEHFGDFAMELEALDVDEVRRRVEKKIRSLIDLNEFAQAAKRTKKMLLGLTPAIRKLLRARA
jgi:hypothetical protein